MISYMKLLLFVFALCLFVDITRTLDEPEPETINIIKAIPHLITKVLPECADQLKRQTGIRMNGTNGLKDNVLKTFKNKAIETAIKLLPSEDMRTVVQMLQKCILTEVSSSVCSLIVSTDSHTPSNFPLLLDVNFHFLYPVLTSSSQRVIQLNTGDEMIAACPGEGNKLGNYDSVNVTTYCADNGNLMLEDNVISLEDLYCSSSTKETVLTTGFCGPNGNSIFIKIGYELQDVFVDLIDICHNESNSNTLFSVHTVYGPSLQAKDTSPENRPSFKEASYYPYVDCDQAYNATNEYVTVSSIVQSSNLGSYYINASYNLFLARGHLSPSGDLIYDYQQKSSYYYINVFPQWQTINGGNWNLLEESIRSKASVDSKVFIVYTGTYNTLRLVDVNVNLVEIYLSNNTIGSMLPSARLAWKVVYDFVDNTGVAFVNINNPYLPVPIADDVICTNVCDQLDWLNIPHQDDFTDGYIYCCTVQELHNVIPYSPNLGNLTLIY